MILPKVVAVTTVNSVPADAIKFCRSHGFTERESNLVAWLIQESSDDVGDCPEKDISDPDVVKGIRRKNG